MAINPPCNCVPTNVNTLAFAKGEGSLDIGIGLDGEKIRPSLGYSLQTNIPNVFRNEAPHHVLTWQASANRSDPKIQRTPRKNRSKVRP